VVAASAVQSIAHKRQGMRKNKVFKIDDKEFTMKELRITDIIELGDVLKDFSLEGFVDRIAEFLPRVTDIAFSDMVEMAPSELETVYETFKEVNASFFSIGKRLGMADLLAQIKKSMIADFSQAFSVSLKQATATHGNTGIPSIQ
jgi:hypothetical protein